MRGSNNKESLCCCFNTYKTKYTGVKTNITLPEQIGSSQTVLTTIIKCILPKERKIDRFFSCISIKPSATRRKISSTIVNMERRNLFQTIPENALKFEPIQGIFLPLPFWCLSTSHFSLGEEQAKQWRQKILKNFGTWAEGTITLEGSLFLQDRAQLSVYLCAQGWW